MLDCAAMLVPKRLRAVLALAGAALGALAAAAPAEAALGYRALCAGEYCFHVSNFAKSRGTSGAGLWDVYYYLSYGQLRPTHYNVRFRDASGRTVQIEIAAGGANSEVRSFGIKPGHVYVISSQACMRSFLNRS